MAKMDERTNVVDDELWRRKREVTLMKGMESTQKEKTEKKKDRRNSDVSKIDKEEG